MIISFIATYVTSSVLSYALLFNYFAKTLPWIDFREHQKFCIFIGLLGPPGLISVLGFCFFGKCWGLKFRASPNKKQ